jgi:hypothetical protein
VTEQRSGLLHLKRLGFGIDSDNRAVGRKEDALVRELVGIERLEDVEVASEDVLGFDNVGRDRRDSEELGGEGGRAMLGLSVDEEEEVDEAMEDLGEGSSLK